VIDSANDTAYIIGGGRGVVPDTDYVAASNLVMAYGVTNGTSWRVAPIPTGVRGASGGIGEDGRIYVFSGYNHTSGFVASTQIYDIATDSWTPGANIPISQWEAKCAVDWPNMYVIGGTSSGTAVQIYNARTNSWSGGVALPVARSSGAATYVASVDSIFYIAGADAVGNAMSNVYRFKIGAASWTEVAQLPSAKAALDATTGADGLIYAVGGSDNALNVVNPVYSSGHYYCVNNDTWFTLPDMNYPRKYLGLVPFENKIMAIGGNNNTTIYGHVESLTTFVTNPTLSTSSIGQGGEVWLNMSLESFATAEGTAIVYYLKSGTGTIYPAVSQIFAAGNISTLIQIPQSMPVGSYEIHAYFGVSFETGAYTLPETIFPFTVFATVPLQQQISDLQDQIGQLELLIDEINSSLSAQLNDTMANITQLQLQLAQMNLDLTLFVSQIQAQIDMVNTSLVNEIAQLQIALDQAKADLATAVSLVNASLSAQLNDTLADIADLQAQNALLQSQITQLLNELDDLEDQMSTNDQAMMDKLNLTDDQMNEVTEGFDDLNETATNSLGSLGTNTMIGLMGLLVALLVAILVVFMSLSRKIKDIGTQQAMKSATSDSNAGSTGAGIESPATEQTRTRTVKQNSPERQTSPPPALPEEKL
jgi:N-acetylneuraminic acid mutarotase